MPDTQTDPGLLEGEALRRWYLRAQREIDEQRRAEEARRYAEFFASSPETAAVPDAETSSIAGYGRVEVGPWSLDRGLASPFGNYNLIDVGNPHNRRLRREYARTRGDWPQTDSNRNFDVAHKQAIADGGTNTLDNIEPMHPDLHRQQHMDNGDFKRWGGRRRSPSPPLPPSAGKPTLPSLGLLGVFSDVTGLLSGRIRTDTFDNFVSDMMGFPSLEDRRKAYIEFQRQFDPNWKPGDPLSA